MIEKLVGRISQILNLLITFRVLTGVLLPDEMGKFGIIMTLFGCFNLGLISPAGMYVNRHILMWYNDGLIWKRFGLYVIYLIAVILVAALALPVLVIFGHVQWGVSIDWLIGLICAQVFINTLNGTIINFFLFLSRDRTWLVLSLITQWGGLLLSFFLTYHAPHAELWLVGQIGGLAVGLAFAIVPLIKVIGTRSSTMAIISVPESFRYVLAFCLPVMVGVVSNWVQFQSYRLVLGASQSLVFLGKFVAGYTIGASAMGAFETTCGLLLLPAFYQTLAAGGDAPRLAWHKYLSQMLPLTLLTTAVVVVFSAPLTHLLSGSAYRDATGFVVLGAVLDTCRIFGNTYSLAAHALAKTKMVMAGALAGAVGVCIGMLLLLHGGSLSQFVSIIVVSGIIYVVMIAHSSLRQMGGRHPMPRSVLITLTGCLMFAAIRLMFSELEPGPAVDLAMLAVAGLIYGPIGFRILGRGLADLPFKRRVSASM